MQGGSGQSERVFFELFDNRLRVIRLSTMNWEMRLRQAIDWAIKRKDGRTFFVASVGVRADGAVVKSRNESAIGRSYCSHAEARLSRKLDRGATVFVARWRRDTKDWALAKPCDNCMNILKRHKVKRVVYTVGPNKYETLRFAA